MDPEPESKAKIALPAYFHSAPSEQNALDIFASEWSSALPGEFAQLRAGTALLFEDPRLEWAIAELGGVAGKSVLELGPLEGGHSYMLEQAGAREVLGIEGNARAFLRCLVVKEILGLKSVRYACGDFGEYLRSAEAPVDVVIASGVLYHQTDPMHMLADIARITSSVYLWTHYVDPELIANNPVVAGKIGAAEERELSGLRYSQYEYRYEQALEWSGFCGGPNQAAKWLPKSDILAGLRHFGFTNVTVALEEPEHPNGPSFGIVATK
jgi:SAM-dependent methyltransferase